MISRDIIIYDFKTGAEAKVKSIKEACTLTGFDYKTVAYQLKHPEARIHELAEGCKRKTLPKVTRDIAQKTQTFACRWATDSAFRVIRVLVDDSVGSYILTKDIYKFDTVTDVAKFLGLSRQTIYNAKSQGTLKAKPLKSKDGGYFIIDTGLLGEAVVEEPKSKCFLGRAITSTGHTQVKMSTNLYDLWMWLNLVSPLPIRMTQEEFFLTCDSLTVIDERQEFMLEGEQYSWLEYCTVNTECTYGFAVSYDSIGKKSKPFTQGTLVARVS